MPSFQRFKPRDLPGSAERRKREKRLLDDEKKNQDGDDFLDFLAGLLPVLGGGVGLAAGGAVGGPLGAGAGLSAGAGLGGALQGAVTGSAGRAQRQKELEDLELERIRRREGLLRSFGGFR